MKSLIGTGFCLEGETTFTLSFKKGRTPRGFSRHIGDLRVTDSLSISSSEIDDYFRKRGLGTLLYVHALKELGSLTTHYHSASVAAKGLWRSLVRRCSSYKVDFFDGTLTLKANAWRD